MAEKFKVENGTDQIVNQHHKANMAIGEERGADKNDDRDNEPIKEIQKKLKKSVSVETDGTDEIVEKSKGQSDEKRSCEGKDRAFR
jgi:hypothetical protein